MGDPREMVVCDVKDCKNHATYQVCFDGDVKGIDKRLLCTVHHDSPPFDKFVIKIIEIKENKQ